MERSWTAGVAPVQYPILRSVTKPPTVESAVHTTPPIMSAASIPALPVSPAATRITEARIRVISVMPETGFVPTVAIACAETVVNRNEITSTIRSAMAARPK